MFSVSPLSFTVTWKKEVSDSDYSLSSLVRGILQGNPTGTELILPGPLRPDKIFGAFLFLRRDVFLHPDFFQVLQCFELGAVHTNLIAHSPFCNLYLSILFGAQDLKSGIDLLHAYFDGSWVPSGDYVKDPSQVTVENTGTNGFVVATVSENMVATDSFPLYKIGFLRGVVFEGNAAAGGAGDGPGPHPKRFLIFTKNSNLWDLSLVEGYLRAIVKVDRTPLGDLIGHCSPQTVDKGSLLNLLVRCLLCGAGYSLYRLNAGLGYIPFRGKCYSRSSFPSGNCEHFLCWGQKSGQCSLFPCYQGFRHVSDEQGRCGRLG